MPNTNLTLSGEEITWLRRKIEMNPSGSSIEAGIHQRILASTIPPKPPGSNYGLSTGTGSHPDCWFLSIRQGPQVFSILAETPEEKKNFLCKLQGLQKAITELTILLEQQTL